MKITIKEGITPTGYWVGNHGKVTVIDYDEQKVNSARERKIGFTNTGIRVVNHRLRRG